MKIIIKAKDFELTEALENFIKKKFSSLEKFIKDEDIFVEIFKETRHHKKGDIFCTEARINMMGKELVATAKEDDIFKAIVEAKNEIKMEIEKRKLKNLDKNRRLQRKNRIE